MDKKEIEKYLTESIETLGRAIQIAVNISQLIERRRVVSRLNWLSVLFIRLCNTSMTVYRILPNNKLAETYYENWDSSSIMALARNFSECYHLFFYLCAENLSKDEWLLRKKILDLHDHVERRKMFHADDKNSIEIQAVEGELKKEIKNNPYFIKLKPEQQTEYLKGKKALLMERTEIENKIGNNSKTQQGLYKFFSQHTHSLPVSFYRMSNEGRGRGVENDIDKFYIAMSADYVSSYLLRAIADTMELFGDVKAKLPKKDIEWLISQKYVGKEPNKPVDSLLEEFLFDMTYKRDNQDLKEHISFTIVKDTSQRRPRYIVVTIPNNISMVNGIFLTFSKEVKGKDGKLKLDIDKEKSVRIPFEKFDAETCTIHVNDFMLDDGSNKRSSTFQKIIDFDTMGFLLTYPDGSHKTVFVPLVSFKKHFK